MASDKKRIGLDKPTRSSVKDDLWSKIDLMIGELDKPVQPDEFTISDYVNRIESQGNVISISQAGKHLLSKVKEGTLTSRKTKIKGCKVNVFRFV